MNDEWTKLTREEKRAQRFRWFLNPEGVRFVDSEAEKSYRTRAERLVDVLNVDEPDQVPVSIAVGARPAYDYGIDYHTAMYDYEKAAEAWERFNERYSVELDSFATPGGVTPAKVYDILDYRLYSYPGRGLPTSATGIQFVEDEYMKADEYDALIKNPSDFWMRVYMPRVFGALEPLKHLNSFADIIELPAMKLAPLARPDVQEALQALIDAGKELSKWIKVVARFSASAAASGFPSLFSGTFCKAPFDTLGDTLRGTKGIMMDMYRRPAKLIEAMDVIADISIDSTIASLNAMKGLRATFPLHKGADGWMSDKQFETLYWPSLRKVIWALIDEGILVHLFAEGSFNTRLDMVNEFPKGAVSWLFDKTDMAKAKQVLGANCCIMGNVPASLMVTGQPSQVKAYCRDLIDTCAPGGGYILSPGAVGIDEAKLENIKAMISTAQEYGVYKK